MSPGAGDGEFVHVPDPAFVATTNVAAFMRAHGIDDHEELIARTTGPVDGVDASGIDWFWDVAVEVLDVDFDAPYDAVRDDTDGPQFTRWYPGGRLNAARNAVTRHGLPGADRRDDLAVVWKGEPGDVRELSFAELHEETSRVANALEAAGVEPGDPVAIFLPMLPEVAPALYGCLAVGAIAVPIFSGFGVDAVATRLADSEPQVLLTADGFHRRGEQVPLKATADRAMAAVDCVERAIVVRRLGDDAAVAVPWDGDRDAWWADAVGGQPAAYEPRSLPAEHRSLLLYSSGTTGAPKGIVHTHVGALIQAAKEIHFGFDHRPDDRFFWLADLGWMMGPWTLLGNHHHGGTVFCYEGAPDHPGPDRLWAMVDRHELTALGVSPTAIRALMEHGTEPVDRHDTASLRLLGSTGEPWDPASWRWYYETVGGGRCPIINISGGTEIMGCFLMPMPTQPLTPGSLGGPGLGMAVDVVDADGESVVGTGERGYLVARDSCPSMTTGLWAGEERYLAEYWSTWPDLWDHGDWARVGADGHWFLLGRADDALNVAGRKVGPAELEAILVEHDAVNQAAVVGVPDETTGTAVVASVVAEPGVEPDDALRAELAERVADRQGKPFRPREVCFVEDLPRTQSGKVVRRVIAAAHQGAEIGDRSSIENPAAIEAIRAARGRRRQDL